MARLPAPSARRRPSAVARRAVGLALAALALSLAGCKDDEAIAATPGGQALIASQPAVADAHVPPPPTIAGIVGVPARPVSGADAGELEKVNAQLEASLNSASACTTDTECRAVGIGGRACGGPTSYRAYSSQSAEADHVDALAQRQRELATAAERASHRASPCFMLANPGARCVQNKCVTGRPDPN